MLRQTYMRAKILRKTRKMIAYTANKINTGISVASSCDADVLFWEPS